MYAIVNIAGQQIKVAKDQQVYVNRLPGKAGDKVTFDEVLLVDDNGKVNVGAPAVSGASVSAKVVEHVKGDKVIVFKKKRRKGYQTRNGHRQLLTKIAIDGISLSGSKKATEKKAESKAEAKKEAPKAKEDKSTQTEEKN
jgi:large subunit ribosomal protein L21